MPDDQVHGEINWERRHKLMRSHTECHILSAVIKMIKPENMGKSNRRIYFSLED
ncbi:MAG: hypothetical protein ACE14P_11565 [Methanotrichaceae archaeon]